MNYELNKVSATVLSRLNELKKNIEVYEPNLSKDDEERLYTLKDEYFKLMHQYDWSNIEFEENGKKGLKDVEGNILVPAIYDGFTEKETYFSKGLVAAKKDGKVALVKTDGTGKAMTGFDYHYIRRIEYTNLYLVTKEEDPDHFALMYDFQVRTPFELEKHHEICDGAMMVEAGGKMGLMAIDLGNIYIRPEYDMIYDEGVGEYFIFVKDGVEGKVTMEGRFVSNKDYDAMTAEEEEELAPNGFIYAPDFD